jgi:hypothetical protein
LDARAYIRLSATVPLVAARHGNIDTLGRFFSYTSTGTSVSSLID